MQQAVISSLLLSSLFLLVAGCTEQSAPSSGSGGALTFASTIQPIVADRCAKCHVEDTKGKLSLVDLASAMAGGKSGSVISPGDAEHSRMYLLVAGLDPEKKMPPKGDPLTAAQVASIKDWINSGAH